MFIKQFKQKSHVQMKTSDYKKLRQRIQDDFPHLNESDVCNLFPSKSNMSVIKIVTVAGINTNIYCVNKRPMFFEEENELVPTLYTLWITPDILPYFTTHTSVLPRLAKGADLMLPGVIRMGIGINSYGHYKKGTLVAVNLTSNKAAVGLGRLVRSSEDLYMSGGHGVCVKLLNVFGDNLWGIEPSVSLQVPNWKPDVNLSAEDFPALADVKSSKKIHEFPTLEEAKSSKKNLEFPTLEEANSSKKNHEFPTLEQSETSKEKESNTVCKDNENVEELPPANEESLDAINLSDEKENMDDVLKSAFLTTLKYRSKDLILPLLTSNFYRLHMLPVAKTQINLKQTSYKKISVFLNEMAKQDFISLRQETKGVEKIISINLEHPELINFIPEPNECTKDDSAESSQNQLFHVAMTELYIITDDTFPFFNKLNFKKGEGISNTQIKKLLKEYVSKSQLIYENHAKKIIKLDLCLAEVCKTQSGTLDDIYHRILSKMTHSYEMRGRNEMFNNKPPIEMSLATRSGNKKVTLVSNLEAYDIILSEFSKVCKQGAAASTSITKSPNQKRDLFQIQGNQIRFIYKILTETYKIPAKQVHGLNLAKNERKKK